MEFEKGQLVDARVIKVDNQGLHLELETREKAFLPKQNMHVGKKKKLTEIFSEGYNLNAKVLSKKKDYYVLTQKEEQAAPVVDEKAEKKSEKKSNKKDKSSKQKVKVDKKKETKPVQKIKEESQEESQEENKSIKLEDLKKLKNFGGMKISVQKKTKKEELVEKTIQQEEVKVLLDVPKNFLEDLVASQKDKEEMLDNLLKRLKERGYLDEV